MARARIVAFYLPQFHRTRENDLWWGENFTDWVNVRAARPLFPGHHQPRAPLGDRYYDLTDADTLHWQADTARAHGIEAFCHFHYWFNGRRLLHRPTDIVLADKSLDFPFCLAWANAAWSRRWKGDSRNSPVLLRQTYPSDDSGWLDHFEYLSTVWSDPRHLRIDGKPVFLMYYPHVIPRLRHVLDLWRSEAIRRGIGELHIVAMKLFSWISTSFLDAFDAIALYQPTHAMFTPSHHEPSLTLRSFNRFARSLPAPIDDALRRLRHRLRTRLTFHDYDELWQRCIDYDDSGSLPIYPGGFVAWDNTPRYGDKARIVRGSTPERFAMWMSRLVDTVQNRPPDRRVIFLNAWNEWAEGNYLEPDSLHGYAYLEGLRSAL